MRVDRHVAVVANCVVTLVLLVSWCNCSSSSSFSESTASVVGSPSTSSSVESYFSDSHSHSTSGGSGGSGSSGDSGSWESRGQSHSQPVGIVSSSPTWGDGVSGSGSEQSSASLLSSSSSLSKAPLSGSSGSDEGAVWKKAEAEAICDLYNSLKPWIWLADPCVEYPDQIPYNETIFRGLEWDPEGHITYIGLDTFASQQGTIPETLGNITLLSTIKLGFNRMNGTIPQSLTKLTLLYQLLTNQR
ncbi:hypothetical protein Pelo_7145 [Pelomyxa schiedti]|nr:hypothetical protein Pelo_7145 [Pelomyxa schiedti]